MRVALLAQRKIGGFSTVNLGVKGETVETVFVRLVLQVSATFQFTLLLIRSIEAWLFVWDAYGSLNITARDSQEVKCVGSTESNNRCRWPSSGSSQQIRAILDGMEGRPPNEALGALADLALLSLCSDAHQDQANNVARKWERAVHNATGVYDRDIALRGHGRRLEGASHEKEVENHDPQVEVETLRTPVRNLPTSARELEIERLRTELAGEREKSALAADELQKARQKCEEVETEYHQMRLEQRIIPVLSTFPNLGVLSMQWDGTTIPDASIASLTS